MAAPGGGISADMQLTVRVSEPSSKPSPGAWLTALLVVLSCRYSAVVCTVVSDVVHQPLAVQPKACCSVLSIAVAAAAVAGCNQEQASKPLLCSAASTTPSPTDPYPQKVIRYAVALLTAGAAAARAGKACT